MRDLNSTVRENLKWQARAHVAANMRGSKAEAEKLLDLALNELGIDWATYATEYHKARTERQNTSGL